MKIAIISDIHGNYQALSAVLKNIKNEKCDQIFCLGDLAMAGPEPQKTVNFIKEQNWKIIQGNTDEMIAEFTEELATRMKANVPIMANALISDVQTLSEENKKYLKTLPKQLEISEGKFKILLVHGSPRRNNEDIPPDLPLDKIEEIIKNTTADIIFCGHTHIPCGYQTNTKQTIINVGSVGRPFTLDPLPCYAILTINEEAFSIEHKFVSYDRDKAANLLKTRDFEGVEQLAEMLYDPKKRHI